MLNLRRTAIMYLVLGVALTACATAASQPTPGILVTTISNTPITSKINATSQPKNTFNLTAEQAQEITVFMNFIQAYNNGRLHEALALLAENVSVSDCDYQRVKVITFQDKPQATEWLEHRISDHDQMEVSRIENENPDPASGRHVIGVVYARRTSTILTKLGFSEGITPTLASKVIFTSKPTLIQSFANAPYGGDPELCRSGN